MKKFITPAYIFAPGASGVGTVDLSAIVGFNARQLVAIINQTRGETIYATGTISLRYTNVAAGVVTLFYDTTTHSAGDVLQVIYEDTTTETVDVQSASLGAPADAVATTDIGTFSIVALIKRGLERWTTLLARIPTALGQALMAASFPVTIASDQSALTVNTGLSQPLTDAQLRALAVPVSGTVTANTGLSQPLTDTQLRALAVAISAASLPLPTGAATEVTTGAIRDILVDGLSAGNITAVNSNLTGVASANSSVEMVVLAGHSTAIIQVTGTFAANMLFQATVDGTNWVTVNAGVNRVTGGSVNSISGVGLFAYKIAGFVRFRVTASAYTSGTAVISMNQTTADGLTSVDSPLPTGSNVIGAVTATPTALTASYQEVVNLTNSMQTVTPPGQAKWMKIMADDTNLTNIRVRLAGSATVSSGMQFQPGRSEDFSVVGTAITIIAETAEINQKIYFHFGV